MIIFFATLNVTIQLQRLKEKMGRKPQKEAKEEGSLYSQNFVHTLFLLLLLLF